MFATSAPPKGIRAVTWPVLWRMPRYAPAIITSQPFAIGPEDAAALIGNRLTPVGGLGRGLKPLQRLHSAAAPVEPNRAAT